MRRGLDRRHRWVSLRALTDHWRQPGFQLDFVVANPPQPGLYVCLCCQTVCSVEQKVSTN